jgi:hypothetical protein
MLSARNVIVAFPGRRQKCEAQMEGDGFLPQENLQYAPIYAIYRWGVASPKKIFF